MEEKQRTSLYCLECPFRTDRLHSEKITNKKGFCSLGYTQNPATKEATLNLLKHNGEICSRNPWIRELR